MSFSISELIVVVLIALVVIKPEQMPEVAMTLGRLTKTIRNLFKKVKHEMNDLIESADKPNERS